SQGAGVLCQFGFSWLLLFLALNPAKNKCDEKALVTTKTKCRSCSLNYEIRCPEGYTKITNSSGIRDCRYYLEIRSFTLSLPGCRHLCMREFQQSQCCQGYWGPECLECPGGAALPCNNKGRCFQGVIGNGTCTCKVCAFSKILPTALKASFLLLVCSCIHGICNSGITGDGKCTCLSGYKGPSCDQPIPECQALHCPENSRCSVSSLDESQMECKCLPNYEGDGKQCEPINPCSKQVCDPHADCLYLGPNRHKCTCQYGYTGDGQVCIPIDPCQTNFGDCPTESTVCKYDGPGKSHCKCKEHFRKFVPGLGCSMTDICATHNPCHKYAECTMAAPGQTQCTCQKGYEGDGYICHGNIMDQIRDMNTKPGGQWQGKLISYSFFCSIFLFSSKGFKGVNVKDILSNKESAQYFVKLHILAGQLDLNGLNSTSTVYTLTGKPGVILNDEKDNLLRIRLQGGKKKVKILQADIVASNGIVHIVDRALDNTEPSFESDKEVRSNTGNVVRPMLDIHPGPNTIFIPTNDAWKSLKDGELDYLLSSKGQILVNGKPIEDADIAAKNGRIYTFSGVLIPPSIIPILPHRCDEERIEIKMSSNAWGKCTQLTPPPICMGLLLTNLCAAPFSFVMRKCLLILQEPKCCKGFFGPDCSQCPGGFSNPCSGNGQCMDGMKGNGTCVCDRKFEGSHCQFCSNPNKYGPHCDKKCMCVYGKCDNQIDSDGICLAGSCKSGYAGKLCDTQVFPCGTFLQFCHAHADCQFTNGAMSCICKPGYEGDGIICSEVDPCANLIPHSCNANAECVKTGPGTHECVCQPGWTGNGKDCSEINNCLLPNFGGCHSNATCLYIGPGQNDCECKEGFRGNGYECELINSCSEQNGKCHPLAVCQFTSSGVWECVCMKGYEGDGSICYGNAAEVPSALQMPPSNLTLLVPSQQAIQNMDQEERNFWMSKNNIQTLIKHHVLRGAYTVSDLQTLSSSNGLATSLLGNFLALSKESGNFSVDGANIVAGDIAATNGIIHVIDKVLTPLRGVSGTLPKLLARLEQMPDYSIFRGYVIQYNLASEIEAATTYTIFAPSNSAIETYLKNKQLSSLDENQIRYHVILEEKLLKNDMHNGMFKETMLGLSFRVGFIIHDGQLYINEAPLSYPNVATDKGIIHGLERVMEIQKNRCDSNNTVVVPGKCLSCLAIPSCPIGTTPLVNTLELNCYKKVVRNLRECCAGFYGPQCEPCPGLAGNTCFGNGICLDGLNGNGTCECEAGFEGVACEKCIKGKYGTGCDQECPCIHGKCNDDIKGDGSCECDVGWRGVKCDEGNCLLNSYGRAYCKCAAGFKGNGTYCTAINACETSNGGCSLKAECRRTTPGNRVCLCNAGYTGDGIVCFEINPCVENNGGCDKNAECTHTGPNQVSNLCSPMATGSGRSLWQGSKKEVSLTCFFSYQWMGSGSPPMNHRL
uniref:Stabilin 2 n=1 Tax=Podarcis muralis TaxID=64176 RepID=A0A670IWM6_PODMU